MKTALKSLLVVGAAASLASAGTCFDYSLGNAGAGTLTGDGSWYQGGGNNSAVVEAPHTENGATTWYPIAKGLDIASCPNGDTDGDGNSDCYYGWNDQDMFTDEGVPEVRVTLSGWVPSSAAGWGYTNGGLLYILDGTGLEPKPDGTLPYKEVNIGSSVTINAKIAAGKTAKVYLLEASYNSADANSGLHKANATGTGSYQAYTLAKAAFSTWATNVADWTKVRAIAVEYEIGAATEGAAFPGQLQETRGWKSLEVDGSCTAGITGHKVAAQSVGFAALRNGLQFSNVGSAALNVQIFNTLGKVVASHKVTAKNSFVSTEGLSNGVYVVRATDGAKLNMMRNVTIMR